MNKTIITLLIVIILLAGLWFLNDNQKSFNKKQWKKVENIEKIVINYLEKEIEIIKENKDNSYQYRLNKEGFLGDKDKIDGLWNILATKREFNNISDNTNTYSRFGLSKDIPRVTIYSKGKKVRSISIGQSTSTFGETYVLIEDDFKVYTTLGDFSLDFKTSISSLRDTQVLVLKKDDIVSIEIKDGSKNFTMTQKEKIKDITSTNTNQAPEKEKVWVGNDEKELDQEKCKEFVDNLELVTCKEFTTNSLEYLKKKKKSRVITILTTNNRHIINLFDKKDNEIEASIDEIKTGFYLDESDTQSLMLSTKIFVKNN